MVRITCMNKLTLFIVHITPCYEGLAALPGFNYQLRFLWTNFAVIVYMYAVFFYLSLSSPSCALQNVIVTGMPSRNSSQTFAQSFFSNRGWQRIGYQWIWGVWKVEGIDRGKIASDRFHFTLQARKKSLFSFIVHNALERMANGPSKANRSHKILEKFHAFHSLIF